MSRNPSRAILIALLVLPLAPAACDRKTTATQSSSPKRPSDDAKTARYWEDWAKLRRRHDEAVNQLQETRYAAHAIKCAEWDEWLAEDSLRLPLAGVDEEVSSLVIDFTSHYKLRGIKWREQAALMQKAAALYAHAESPEAVLESFLRGLVGDPLGKHEEIKQADQRLQGDMEAFAARSLQLNERYFELANRRDKIRARLSSHLNKELPR